LLVVDDNEENRELLARRLARRGYRVLLAGSGPDALEIVGRGGVDLALLDVTMPGMDGFEVLREIRRTISEVELPVVMVTARTASDDVVEALELGANDYVTKPLDFPVVLARIKAHLRQRQSAHDLIGSAGPLVPGAVVAERYRIEAEIGSGAFGAVYRARHLDLERPVAVKVLRTSVPRDGAAAARFRREGISACRVKHPHAVSVLDFGVTDRGEAYLAMELLAGRSLAEELRAVGPLSSERAASLLVPVCEALAAAHAAGVIHRDIKPSNIFLHQDDGGAMVKVLDFGIAKLASDAASDGGGGDAPAPTLEGSLLGTPAYMAPERHAGGDYDGKSDVYSVGVTLFEALTGRLPFGPAHLDPLALAMLHLHEAPPAPSSVDPRIPREMEAVVLAALHKRAENRPDAAALARALAALA
jgi:CheY-like chemotaxis protein